MNSSAVVSIFFCSHWFPVPLWTIIWVPVKDSFYLLPVHTLVWVPRLCLLVGMFLDCECLWLDYLWWLYSLIVALSLESRDKPGTPEKPRLGRVLIVLGCQETQEELKTTGVSICLQPRRWLPNVITMLCIPTRQRFSKPVFLENASFLELCCQYK